MVDEPNPNQEPQPTPDEADVNDLVTALTMEVDGVKNHLNFITRCMRAVMVVALKGKLKAADKEDLWRLRQHLETLDR